LHVELDFPTSSFVPKERLMNIVKEPRVEEEEEEGADAVR
jgi:hypothetical protein